MKFRCTQCGHRLEGERDSGVECPGCLTQFKIGGPKENLIDPDCPESWRIECERAVWAAASLLKLAKRNKWAEAAIVEIIRTAPYPVDDIDKYNYTCLFFRVVLDAGRFSKDDQLLCPVMQYFHDHLRHMPAARRGMLEASLAGSLTGLEMA
jgi:hypothetical protein